MRSVDRPSSNPTVTLPSGETVARLGFGTWRMGERAASAADEIAAIKLAIDLGATLIDTAEMYGEGGAEERVAKAVAGQRDKVFIVSKVYPHNATRTGVLAACERSLKRLGTDRIDLYLLHWRGQVALTETVEAFEHLRAAGKIRYWGVSNFDVPDMQALLGLPLGNACATNQVLYNLAQRAPEQRLLIWQRQHAVTTMAYSPIDQGKLLKNKMLVEIATAHHASPAQIALAWLLRMPDVITIPKATKLAHVRENMAALAIELSDADLAGLDRAFPKPKPGAAIGIY